MQNSDFLKDFVEEAIIHSDEVESGLLNLEVSEWDNEIINGIFRNVHSIKGTASFFALERIVELSHAMENLFGEIRSGNLGIDKKMVDVLLSANDCLKKMIGDVDNCHRVDISEHTSKLADVMSIKTDSALAPDSLIPESLISASCKEISESCKEIYVEKGMLKNILESISRGLRLYIIALP
ncbi:MAG: Hpt domain-containing protein, partial [Desulfocucumaceae bacterium]